MTVGELSIGHKFSSTINQTRLQKEWQNLPAMIYNVLDQKSKQTTTQNKQVDIKTLSAPCFYWGPTAPQSDVLISRPPKQLLLPNVVKLSNCFNEMHVNINKHNPANT